MPQRSAGIPRPPTVSRGYPQRLGRHTALLLCPQERGNAEAALIGAFKAAPMPTGAGKRRLRARCGQGQVCPCAYLLAAP